MALTKPRAYQIFDLDYKQSVRVLTATNVTLSGGAPNSVDGINLSQNDRVLVKSQDTASQNGLYIVTTVGTGSNGTWARSVDGNETGEIQAGMIVMVTEGNTYKDTQWKLVTNDPIVLGVTALTFELNTSTNQILNGNSNVSIASLGSNVTVGVGGSANVATFTTTGITANNIATDGNLVVGNNLVVNGNLVYVNVTDLNIEDPIIGLGRGPNNTPLTTDDNKDRGTQLWYYTTSEQSAFVGWDDSAGKLIAASNVTITNEVVTVNNYGTLLTGNIEATGNVSPTANITYDLGSTNLRWRDIWLSNSTIYIGNATIGAVGNTLTVNGANVLTGNAGSAFSTTGNVTGGNITTTGIVSATGNITGSYVFGNGSQLTGLQSFVGATGLTGATGNIGATGLTGATGNIGATGVAGTNGATGASGIQGEIGATGVAGTNGATGLTGATGTFSGTLTSNVDGGGFNISNVSSVSTTGFVSAIGNINAGNVIATGISGTLSTAAQTNITLLGTLTSLSVTGNVQGGNLRTVGIVSAAGNVQGGNVVASANLISGNITTTGIVSATGNITGNYVFGNGSQLTGLQSFVGATGASGIQGIAGDTGATGASGIQGIQGTIGATGASGIQGTTGNIGATGTAGTNGATGLTGATGTAGTNGATGPTGATGTFNGTLTANVDGGGFSISNVATIATTTLISSTGNVQGGNIRTAGLISATGNITGSNLLINGNAQITGNLSVSGTETIFNVANLTVNDLDIIVANNVTGGANINGAGIQAGNPATATWFYNNATTSWQSNIGITPTANGTLSLGGASNFWGNAFLTTASVTGNVQGGNIRTVGIVSATGNITGNFILGNGSQLTGLQSFVGATGPQGAVGNIGATGASGIQGNIGATGTQGIQGNIGATGTQGIQGNIGATGATGPQGTTGNTGATGATGIQGTTGNTGATGTFSGTLTANINGGGFSISNVATVAATTLISSTGNVIGGNITTGGLISATSTITSAANITGGNIRTAGLISATGNVTGNYFIGNGSALTGITASGGITWTTVANTAPANATPGSFWYNSFNNVKYQYINDGDSSQWVDQSYPTSFSTLAVTGNITSGNLSVSTGTVTLGNIVNANGNGVGNIGSAGSYFNTVFAKATSAQYADLAEYYLSDAEYAPGTVVVFGGEFEITQSTQSHSTTTAGVISTNPSYLMNSNLQGKHVLAVALTGRVPCRVTGVVNKGDRLVTSKINGVATVLNNQLYEPGCIIGKALENYNSDTVGIIEIAVGRY
jgi:hypothetical protein